MLLGHLTSLNMDSKLGKRIVSMINLLKLISVPWLCKRMSLVLEFLRV